MSNRATQLKNGFDNYTKSHNKSSCKRFKKAVTDRFALHEIASIQKNGAIYAWNGSESFYLLPDIKRDVVLAPLVPFTIEEFGIALG